MTVFIITAAVLLITALILVAPPLLGRGERRRDELARRELNLQIHRDALAELDKDRQQGAIDEAQYQQSKRELEQRLLEEVDKDDAAVEAKQVAGGRRVVAIITLLFIPLSAVGLYQYLGSPEAFAPRQVTDNTASMGGGDADLLGAPMQDRINSMVAKLATRLQDNPDDAEGWMMLGRSYIVLDRFEDARAALEKAAALKQDDPQLLVDLADALAMTSSQSLVGRPTELIARALMLDPTNQKALWLAGTAAFEQGSYAEALQFWRQLATQLPAGSETARVMAGNIAEAQALLEGREPPSAQTMPGAQAGMADASAGSNGPARVSGRVSLAPELRDRASPDDTVFIFARAASGPPMPLAVKRVQVRDLPLDFVLDESMAMSPQMTLARFPQVVVGARISRSGNAMPSSGDLQGISAVVAVGSEVPEIVIDEVVP